MVKKISVANENECEIFGTVDLTMGLHDKVRVIRASIDFDVPYEIILGVVF